MRATGRDKKAERRGYRRELKREEERAFTEEAGTEKRGCSLLRIKRLLIERITQV